MSDLPIISIVTFLPLLGVVALLVVDRQREALIKHLAFGVSVLTFLVSLQLYRGFQLNVPGMQFVERKPWIPGYGVQYFVGVDGISLLLVLLTTFLTAIAILSSYTAITTSVKEYMICMLLLETGMLGVFVALDLVLFYVFWEGMLIPMYFLIGVWGGPRRIYATIKFFLYTMAGGVLMLVGIITLYYLNGGRPGGEFTFDLLKLSGLELPFATQAWLFLAFAVAFAIKVPMFPFHTWLPDAHVEAPTAGSVILAGVLLKMGTYGFLRFALPLFPEATRYFAPLFSWLAIIGILYGALVSMVQPDLKKLVAYSSVSHLGFVMLGIFALTIQGMEGAILQMINHGLSTGALFLVVGMIYERRHSRMIEDFGGLARIIPVFTAFFMIVTLSSIGLPGLNGFVGEFLILVGTFRVNVLYAVLATLGVILAAVYMLWMFQRVMFGTVTHDANRRLPDLTAREIAVLVPVIVFIVWIGIYPRPFLATTEASVKQLLAQVHVRYRAEDREGESREPRAEKNRQRQRSYTQRVPVGQTGPISSFKFRRSSLTNPKSAIRNPQCRGMSPAGWKDGVMEISLPSIPWGAMLPMLLVAGTGLAVLILDPLTPPDRRERLAALSLIGIGAAAVALVVRRGQPEIAFGGMLAADDFALFFNLLFLLVAGLTVLISIPYVGRVGMEQGEYYALLLFSSLGMMIMASSLDLMTIFLGLETLSISLYILAGFLREQLKSNEAALKYLLLGAFASGFVLYGIALVYGATGSINLKRVAEALASGKVASHTLLIIGTGLLIIGFGFKVASVPFHMWTPDVYEGAPTSVTAFMIAGTKAAAFAAFLRILLTALPSLQADWSRVLWVLAVLTMTVGNVVAIAQSNIKRMLAYSSIAHAGYILVALVSASKLGGGSVLFYLAAYTFMNLGAFAVVIALARQDGERVTIDDYAGLGLKYPFLGAAMALFMFSLAGIPPTGGFMGKFYIFSAAIQANYLGLAIIGVLNSVISVYYYLRITVVMYMSQGEAESPPGGLSPALVLAVLIAILGTLQLGLFPSRVLEVALRSVGALLL